MVGKIEPLVGVGVEAVDVLADHVSKRVLTEQLEEGGIRVEDFSSRVAAADAVRGVGDQGTKIELGPAEVFLGGSQRGVEPANQHREEEEKRQPHDRDAKLIGSVFTHQREVGAYGKRERGGDKAGLPAAVPRADHHSDAKKSETAFRDVGEQNGGNESEGRTKNSNTVAQDGRSGRRDAE